MTPILCSSVFGRRATAVVSIAAVAAGLVACETIPERPRTVFTDWVKPNDAVAALTYVDDGREVTCTMPDVFYDETVTPSGCDVTFYRKDLMIRAVNLRVRPANGVWLVTPVGADGPITVVKARGQQLKVEPLTTD